MFTFITILFIFLCCYQYHSYNNLKVKILKDGNDYYLKALILEENINNINNTYLIINNKKYKYKVKSISEDYLLDEKYNKYYEVLIESKIDSNLIINNNIIDASIEMPKTTFLKKQIEKIKKGME